MGIIVDLILIVCLAVFIIIGYRKGLTGSLLKLISFAVAIVLAIILYKPLASAIINNTKIDENMKASIIDTFNKEENGTAEEKSEEKGIESAIVKDISKEIENATAEAKTAIIEKSANDITITIINIGSAIIVYLVARVILIIISFFVNGITQLPIIKQIDKTGGIIYGLLEGAVIIYIVLGIISFANVMWPGNAIAQAINKSAIGSMMYGNNIILNILFK